MFSVSRWLLTAACLAAGTVGVHADGEGGEAQTRGLADYISAAKVETSAAPVKVAQAENGQPVYDFEFERAEREQPQLLEDGVFNRRVTLDFKNADIQNVIRLIAARTGLNILMDPNEVAGRITLSLENVPLGYALDTILKVNKLAYIVEPGGIVRIVPESRVGREQVETQTEIINLNWRDAKDVEATFRSFLTPHGDMKANEEAQALIVTDVPPNILKIRELIQQIDRPDRQVNIRARLVDIGIGAGRALTTEWAAAKVNKDRPVAVEGFVTGDDGNLESGFISGSNAGLLPFTIGGVSPVTLEGAAVNGGLGTLQFGSIIGILGNDFQIDATLTALENRDVVEVLANPNVTTLNNVPALIRIVERIPYIEAVQGAQGIVVGEVEFDEAGVIIEVKPIITPNHFIRLDIELEQRILRGRVGAGSLDARAEAFNPPQIDVRNAATTVIVQDKNTVVLGGLRQLRTLESTDGVPWLNRIPVLGWAFKDKSNRIDKSELLLMVTPEVVEQALLTDDQLEYYNRIDTRWHLPDYFLDDVSNVTTD